LSFGVECKQGATATYCVYAGNLDAAPVVEFLRTGAFFANGGFEAGKDGPERWVAFEETDQHQLAWVADEPHGGKRCVRCTVEAGAPPSWVKWMQDGIAIEPNADYRLEGWVKGKDVKGSAGFYIHVHGDKPQALNRLTESADGTFGWRRVAAAFRTPPDSVRASIGTILRGTGTAWYDDVRLVLLTKKAPLVVTAAKPEVFRLAAVPAPTEWRDAEAGYRVALHVRNWSTAAMRSVGQVELAPLTRRLPLVARRGVTVRVVDPATGHAEPSFRAEGRLLFEAEAPARSERVYHAYIRPADDAREPATNTYAALVASDANRLANAGFEAGDKLPAQWDISAQTKLPPEKLHRGSRDKGAKSGQWCARLDVPKGAPLAWSGWHQTVKVKPLTTYLFGAWLRTQDVEGSVQLHAHWHAADGKLCQSGAFAGVGPALSRTQDWTLLLGTVRAPADAAIINLHLTMNAHGTVWHDDVLFCEAATALIGDTTAQRPFDDPVARRRGYAAWAVNPIVKVFREDLPSPTPRTLALTAARNESEPVQLVVRAATRLQQVAVTIEPPRHHSGKTLDDVDLHLVGYVPIDHPSSYYRSESPAWYRKRPPRGTTGCDGWAGQWPDPLPPYKPFDLEPGISQPVWATVHVPADAPAGLYRGALVVAPANAPPLRLPLEVTVWDFAIPRRPSLKIIYDMREGFLKQFGGSSGTRDEMLDRWHRFLAERRVSPGILPPPKFTYKGGALVMDTKDFDRHASFCLDTLGMSAFYSPWFLYSFGWAHAPRRIFGLEPFSPEHTQAYQRCLTAYCNHLRRKGWYDRMLLYISDEPHFTHAHINEQMIKVCQMLRAVEPKIPIYSSTWRHVPEWHGHINVWGAGQYGCFPVETMKERQKAGDKILLTTDGQQCLDTPYCATERLLPWYCWKYGAIGYEFWGVNWWTYAPWDRGWHRYISQSSDGVKYFHVRYPNGDGYLTYPGARVGVDGPVSSVRLEQAREGAEDYEYFVLLDGLLAKAKARGLDVAAAEAARKDALALVEIPNKGGRYSTTILPDPDVVPRLRTALAKAIVELSDKLR
ncbi:DUF4091 domain-containing protein, partial [bacterium]|nr:DUF4091 domain-containing protein [bacterium]